jgi:cytochrome c peroxidase
MSIVHVVARHHAEEYERLFEGLPDLTDRDRFPLSAGPLADEAGREAWRAMRLDDRAAVDRVFANVGKAIAAYERRMRPGRTRLDDYVAAVADDDVERMRATLSAAEAHGLRLFVGRANCIECHNGPLLTNFEFHNTALPSIPGEPLDPGRQEGVLDVLADAFNCLSPTSDADPESCAEIRFVKSQGDELLGAIKTPSLRNVAATAPYMHKGQFATLREVLEHYDEAPESSFGHSDLKPLGLSRRDFGSLEAFLRVLTAPIDVEPRLLQPPD